jgi:dsRNA-specific ribonuclease
VVWSVVEQQLLTNYNLTKVAIAFGIHRQIFYRSHLPQATASMMATAIEAIVGAACLDGGEEPMDVIMTVLGLQCLEAVEASSAAVSTDQGNDRWGFA